MFELINLDEIATFIMGQSPSSFFVEDNLKHTPFLQGCADFGYVKPIAKVSCSTPKKVCQKDDVLVSVRAPVGALNKADRSYCIGRGIAAIRFLEGTNSDFGWHLLNYWIEKLKSVSQGSTFEAVGKKELTSLKVAKVPYCEHRAIAHILDTIDEAIQKTEQLITKLKAIKQGMLHDLLTRGLDENGRLRDPVAHPEQFKPSPLGLIPKEWKIDTISKVCKIINGGTPTTNINKYWNGDIPWLTVEDFNTGKRFVYEAAKSITQKGLMESATSLLPKGALIISARGTVGVIAQLGREMAFNQSCYGLISVKRECSENYIFYFLNEFMDKFKQATFGSVFYTITRATFEKIIITYPPNEQESERIVEKLTSVDSLLEKNQKEAEKLRLLKKGLMHDLLTGTVRVNIKQENLGQVKGGNPL